MLVSDAHSVDSHPVYPDLDVSETTIKPTFTPDTVRRTDPVDTVLLRTSVLSDGISKVKLLDIVPTLPPEVIDTTRLPPTLGPVKQRNDVSEIQLVASHPVSPTPMDADEAPRPKSDP